MVISGAHRSHSEGRAAAGLAPAEHISASAPEQKGPFILWGLGLGGDASPFRKFFLLGLIGLTCCVLFLAEVFCGKWRKPFPLRILTVQMYGRPALLHLVRGVDFDTFSF